MENVYEEEGMKIVIIGDGKVGFKLAEQLAQENYDVVMIDSNETILRDSMDRLDISCVTGNGCSIEVQKEADVPRSELVIACTSTDEINMLSCLIAKRLGTKHTIARVRNPVYYEQIDLLKEDMHLSMVVNPERMVALDISRILILPDTSMVETFAKGRVELVEFALYEGCQLIGYSLAEIYIKTKVKFLVCAVEQGENFIIPKGDYVCQTGDRLFITAAHDELVRLFRKYGQIKARIRNVMIGGGGRISYYLSRQLLKLGFEVKIIERNETRCLELYELLPQATIILGDANDHELLQEEGIERTDAFIALTGMDEENIVMSLFAKSKKVPKIIVKVNADSRAKMLDSLGFDCVVSPKIATADAILSYVRAKRNSQGSANVESLLQLADEKLEAIEFYINKKSKYTNVKLKVLPIKTNNIIACIARNREIIIPGGEDAIQVGDYVIVITTETHIQDFWDILNPSLMNRDELDHSRF